MILGFLMISGLVAIVRIWVPLVIGGFILVQSCAAAPSKRATEPANSGCVGAALEQQKCARDQGNRD